jgi:inhibitor of Bruton tyrosine kinase
LERYPDLERRIAQERQSKIDSILLLNKYGDNDSRAQAPYKAGSFHELSETPLQQKARRGLSKDVSAASPSPAASPALRSRRSANDLIFEMDEDDEEELGPLSSLTDRLREASSPDAQMPASASANTISSGRGKSPFATHVHPSASVANPNQMELAEAIPSPKIPGRPWGATPLPTTKLNIKEVIDQASSSRTSSLSIGLSIKSNEPKGPRSFTGKMSQKERKRLMQAQLQGETSLPAVVEPPEASPSPASPWQLYSSKPKSAPRTYSDTQPPKTSGGSRTPQLTMRQTIANPGPSSKPGTPATLVPQSPQARSISNPQLGASPQSTPKSKRPGSSGSKPPNKQPADAPGFAISGKPVPVQSVRHTPQRARDSLLDQRSMLEILSEQAIEKTAIKDFAAKRSLQEIQQEQEFQEWWDKERARVMEEEESAAANVRRDGAGRGGRGKKRGRGGRGGKGKEKAKTGVGRADTS